MRVPKMGLLTTLALAAALASPTIGNACTCSEYCFGNERNCMIDCPSCLNCTCENYGSYIECCYQDKDGQWHCSDIEC